tara:strand:+ start:367 stop:747 length:381 start_codon:yes stop_codon:yes gene_type:complete
MPNFTFSARSWRNLENVDPRLIAVASVALLRSPVDFTILEGRRTEERQAQLVAQGSSKTMNSRHLTGHAIDIAPWIGGKPSWDWTLYNRLAPIIKTAALELGVDIEWGGDWRSFKDGPHWQIPWGQ